MACSSVCMLYGFRRDDSAAAIHCLAYSAGDLSVGIDCLGRTSYCCRRIPATETPFVYSFEPSNPVGDVDILERDVRAEEASSRSVFIVEAIESRALSGFKKILPPDMDFEISSALKVVGVNKNKFTHVWSHTKWEVSKGFVFMRKERVVTYGLILRKIDLCAFLPS